MSKSKDAMPGSQQQVVKPRSCYELRYRTETGRIKVHDFTTTDIIKEVSAYAPLRGCEIVQLRQIIRQVA